MPTLYDEDDFRREGYEAEPNEENPYPYGSKGYFAWEWGRERKKQEINQVKLDKEFQETMVALKGETPIVNLSAKIRSLEGKNFPK